MNGLLMMWDIKLFAKVPANADSDAKAERPDDECTEGDVSDICHDCVCYVFHVVRN